MIAGDSARSRFELRCCKRSSEDAVGNDADRIEFRYRDANNRIDMKCSRTSVPGTWLTVSHISGPTLINTIKSVRENRARVEGPEQTEQFAQLAAIHQDWWKASFAADEDGVGSYVTFVEGLDEGNFHVIARSKLMVREGLVVPARALAEMQHVGGVAAPVGPPALTSEAWLSSSERATQEDQVADVPSSEAVVTVQKRAGYELNQRSFTARHYQEGAHGHMVDDERDKARTDRRFARSTAHLTPALFRDEMERRVNLESTAIIEEVDAAGAQPSSHGRKPEKVPQSSPTVEFGTVGQAAQTAPRSSPQSFGPQDAAKVGEAGADQETADV